MDKYLKEPDVITKTMLSKSRKCDDLPQNETQIEQKSKWTGRALKALLVESALLLTMSLLTVFL